MEIEYKSKRDNLITVFFILFFILMLFGFNDEVTSSSVVYKNIVVPYFNINITIALALLSIITIIFLIIFKKRKIDIITLLLFVRIGLYSIPIIYVTGDFKIGVFYAMFQCAFSYFIGSNSNKEFKSIVNLLIIYTIAITIEEIYVLVINNISIFSSSLKWYMVLPMGKSNYISCVLLPIYVLVSRFYKENKIFTLFYTMIIFFAILATGSKLALILFLLYMFYEHILKSLFQKHYTKNIVIGFVEILITIIIIILLVNKYYTGILTIIMKFTQNNIFENRILVYKDVIDLIFEHFFFGRSAYTYNAFDAVKAHNFIFESLIQTGIIGTVIYIYALIKIFKGFKKINNSNVKYAITGFFVIYLIQGLAEPNLFGAVSDAFFWIMIGIGMSYSRKINKIDESESIYNKN